MNNSIALITGTLLLLGGVLWKVLKYVKFYKVLRTQRQRQRVLRDGTLRDCIVGPNLRAISEAILLHPEARVSMPVRDREDAKLVLESSTPRIVYITKYTQLSLELRNFINKLDLQGSEVVLLTNE